METSLIHVADIVVTRYQREIIPWTVEQIANSIKDHGFNIAYPVVLDNDNTLVDGGHRLAAALACDLKALPFIRKPEGVSNLKYSMQCNADRGLGRENDIFDYAELCWKLGNQEAQQVLGWSAGQVSKYSNIIAKLHPLAWKTARFPNICTVGNPDTSNVGNGNFPIGNWSESHFRALLSHLPLNGHRDNAVMRGQLAVIRQALSRFSDDAKKVTAKWIDQQAQREAWHIELKRSVRDSLIPDVGLGEWRRLIKSINNGAFGNEPDEHNKQRLENAIYALNERILGVQLLHGDALHLIPLLADKSVSLVIADQPYNVTDHEWDKIGNDEQYIEWVSGWLGQVRPKLQDNYHLFLFCAPDYIADIEMMLRRDGWPIKSKIVWSHRNMSMGRDVSDRFIRMWEMIYHIGSHPLNWPPEWGDERFEVQEIAAPQSNFKNDPKFHPTSKPISLIELLVKTGSKPGDVVLDPFAGGGTTGQACKVLGQRQCKLIEINSNYCQIIEQRLGIKRAEP